MYMPKNKRLEVLTKIFGEGEKNICQKICWNQKIRCWKFSPNFGEGEKNMYMPKNKRLEVLTKIFGEGEKNICQKMLEPKNKMLEVLTKILVKEKNICQKYVGSK